MTRAQADPTRGRRFRGGCAFGRGDRRSQERGQDDNTAPLAQKAAFGGEAYFLRAGPEAPCLRVPPKAVESHLAGHDRPLDG